MAKLTIKDEVNISISDLPIEVRRKLVSTFSYENPTAKYTPQYKLGGWDGKVVLFSIGGSGYIHQLERILEVLESYNIEIDDVDDQRYSYDLDFKPITTNYWADRGIVWGKGHPMENQSVTLREDQVGVINRFLDQTQALQVITTSGGKTIMSATLAHICEPIGKTITIVPNKTLVEQTYADFKLCDLDVGVYFGDKKELDKTHTICTWQSLNVWDKKNKATADDRMSLVEFLADVTTVLVDECHGATASVLQTLLTQKLAHCPIRWGFTGTIPKLEHQAETLFATIGPVVGKVTAKELQDSEIISTCHIHAMQLLETVAFRNYQDELKFLTSDTVRLDFIAKTCVEIAKGGGNTLVLVDRIECGQYLNSKIPGSEFIYGNTKSKDRKEQYTEVGQGDGKILLASYGIAAVGISITRLHNVVMIEPGKSFVRVIQSIGRGLRKGFDKDHVDIWDITSTCKYSKRHLTARKQFYKEAEYPFSMEKVDYRK